MNISFCKAHMETLAYLMKLAEKHDCRIHFGFDTNYDRELDKDIAERHGLTDALHQEMDEKMNISDSASTFSKIWFELYDMTTESYSSMAYIESSTYFLVEKLGEYDFRSEEDQPSEELITWLEEHDKMWGYEHYTINESHNPTIIHGFGNEKPIEDYRCYRSGMALAYFSDLVCDYLKEPRIHRVY